MYRKAYFTRELPGLNEVALRMVCREVVYLTKGTEGYGSQEGVIRRQLRSFDPEQDLIIPSGPSWINLLLGCLLVEMFPGCSINFGIYSRRKDRYNIVNRRMGGSR